MGQKDMSEKLLEDYPDVFADIVDVLMFHGKRVIDEDDLADIGLRSQYKADDAKLHEQERDVAKLWKQQNIGIALIGLKNQSVTDRDMPLRVINYDGASYRSQMLGKSSKRYPVFTLVLYYGKEPWTGPRSLSECMEIPEGLSGFFSDYRINVIDICSLSKEQVGQFQSDFQIVADYFVQQHEHPGEYAPSEKTICHQDALLKLLKVFTGDPQFETTAEELRKEGKVVKNMSEVLDRIEARGIKLGEERGEYKAIYKLVQQRIISPDEGATFLSISVDALKCLMEENGYTFPED